MTAPLVSLSVRRLPYERHVLVESRECPRCHGSGKYGTSSRQGSDCFSCRAFGRLPTMLGRQLLEKVSLLIGGNAPVDDHGRFDGSRLRQISAHGLRAGMRIREYFGQPNAYRIVTSVEFRGDQGIIVRLDRGYPISTTGLTTFSRELTDLEIDRADVFLAQSIGNGAVRLSE